MLDSSRRKRIAPHLSASLISCVPKINQPSLSEGLAEKPEASAKQLLAVATRAVLGKGYSRSPTYSSWNAMLGRCYRPTTHSYEHYGGRGITVCDRWRQSFLNFITDMGERPAGLVLDRKEVNGNYEPGNCRWVTQLHSQLNKRATKIPYKDGDSLKSRRLELSRRNYREHPERKRAAARARYYLTKEARAAYSRRYYQKHRMRLIAGQILRNQKKKSLLAVST